MNPEIFKNSFRNLAKPSRFQVTGFDLPESSRFMIKAASVPAETIGTIDVPYQGRKIKMAGDRTYAPWTITVMNASSFDLHSAFLDWMASINDPVTNLGADPAVYKRSGQFDQLNEQDQILKTFDFIGAYPEEVSNIETNWDSTDAYQEFTVTLAYDYHISS